MPVGADHPKLCERLLSVLRKRERPVLSRSYSGSIRGCVASLYVLRPSAEDISMIPVMASAGASAKGGTAGGGWPGGTAGGPPAPVVRRDEALGMMIAELQTEEACKKARDTEDH